MHFLTNVRGYTLMEALFQLIVVLVFAHFVVIIILWFTQIQKIETIQHDMNWELFVVDLREYLREAKYFTLINNGKAIQFQVWDEGERRIFIVEKSATNHIRKRSVLGGNEIMLPYVKEMVFSIHAHTLNVQIQMMDGQKRERIFIVPNDE